MVKNHTLEPTADHPSPTAKPTGRGPVVGRFAPTPSGPLHFGSLVTALASWLDARAAQGRWLVRIEDLDRTRNQPGADAQIIRTLEAYGLAADGPIVWQSERQDLYQSAFERLQASGLLYPCICSRREISARSTALGRPSVYPGTCRTKPAPQGLSAAWRVRVNHEVISFVDAWQGPQCQNLATEVGDFVLRRADGVMTYQLAVVVDDAEQQVTHVVRGADLMDSTPRQIYLQRLLGLTTPCYRHVALATDEQGEKLSKQNLALPLDCAHPLPALFRAALHLGLGRIDATSVDRFMRCALSAYQALVGTPQHLDVPVHDR